MALQSGHKVTLYTKEDEERYKKLFNGMPNKFIRLMPNNWYLIDRFQLFADKIYNFKFKSSDVLLMTFPKCGTTWTQEIIWTMRNNPNLSHHPKAGVNPNIRAPFLEADMFREIKLEDPGVMAKEIVDEFLELCPDKDPKNGVHLQMAEFTKEPRTLKTHLPFSLLSPSLLDTTKVVYVMRNPKDVMVSMCHHMKVIARAGFNGTLEDYVNLFTDDLVLFGPYGPHVKEAWERRNHPNLHFIFYEDMKADHLGEIKKLNTFMETNLTEKQMEGIVKYTSFEEMKARDSILKDANVLNQDVVKKEGGLYRKGQTGDWKNKFTPEMDAKVNKWIEKSFTSFGFTFK